MHGTWKGVLFLHHVQHLRSGRDVHLWVVWLACLRLLDTISKDRSKLRQGCVKSQQQWQLSQKGGGNPERRV